MAPTTARKLKIYFQAIDGCIGHLNACQGLAEVLADRGHEVAFLVTSPEKETAIQKLGFKAIQLGDGASKKKEEGQGHHGHSHEHKGHDHGHQQGHDHGHDHGHSHGEKVKGHHHGHHEHPVAEQANANLARGAFARKTPLEQLQSQMEHFSTNSHLTGNFATTIEMTPKLESILSDKATAPDVIILDTFIISPAILRSAIPWCYLFSANPLGLYRGERVPPFGAGFATSGQAVDPASWADYKNLQNQLGQKAYTTFQQKLNQQFKLDPSLDPYSAGGFFPRSPYLNIFGYPEELSYNDIAPMPEQTISVDAFARSRVTDEADFRLPDGFWDRNSGEKLLFFSLGSQASANLALMRRILAVLGKHRAKYIVSKGPNGDQLTLPANCFGANYLPQPAILPLVDAVITHGGNNSFTETFAAGKPMLVLPLSGDHLDNAVRLEEKGYGIRLPTHDFTDEQLTEAVKKLLTDQELIEKARKAGERIQAAQSKVKAAERIEALVG